MKVKVKVMEAHKAISFFWVMEKWSDFATSCGFTKINFPQSSEQLLKISLQNKKPLGPLRSSVNVLRLDPPLGKLPIVPLLPSSL